MCLGSSQTQKQRVQSLFLGSSRSIGSQKTIITAAWKILDRIFTLLQSGELYKALDIVCFLILTQSAVPVVMWLLSPWLGPAPTTTRSFSHNPIISAAAVQPILLPPARCFPRRRRGFS